MASPPPTGLEAAAADASQPFRNVVVCCTSIPPERRTELAHKVVDLGGLHKYDLTPDVTHLVVGDYDTPKYRHVARERPDILAMDAAWIEAVSELWRNDEAVDMPGLEAQHRLRPLEKSGAEPASAPDRQPSPRQGLLICQTGFGDERDEIAALIRHNGGHYTGDLTRRCSHLIVNKPEGKKFTAAKSWGLHTVTLDWLRRSIERGMILDESKFDPLLPPTEQGLGACLRRLPSTKRRQPPAADHLPEGTRKLRKTASIKLSSQTSILWGDILGRSASSRGGDPFPPPAPPASETNLSSDPPPPGLAARPNDDDDAVFSHCLFAIHGFQDRRKAVLVDTIATLRGSVLATYQELASSAPPARQPLHRFIVVPQNSSPESHPRLADDSLHLVTEFYVERCLHGKQFFLPTQSYPLGLPFPRFPIAGFSRLAVCTAAFTGLELSQVARAVVQLGASFEEHFKPSTSLLVCRSLRSMRREKLRCALQWGVPVVPADWLWECISTGSLVSIHRSIFPELVPHYPSCRQEPTTAGQEAPRQDNRSRSPPAPGSGRPGGGPDDGPAATASDFMAPGGRPIDTFAIGSDADALGELSGASVNRSCPLGGAAAARTRIKSEPSSRPLIDRASAPSRLPSAPPSHTSAAIETDTRPPAPDLGKGSDAGARARARDEERQRLSSKLSSLLPAASGTDESGTGTGKDGARPRRRQILGRAISSASNASSADAGDGDTDRPPADEMPPPATQLQYRDPQAQECKAALMTKMMLGPAADAEPAPGRHPVAPTTKLAGGRSLRKR